MTYSCYKCNIATVDEEYTRCPPCEVAHKELAAKLDARPRQKVEKVREKLYPLKEVRDGIEKTMWIDKSTAQLLGIKLSE